eukprot:scaffold53061_cov54-Phaeocystis_antarctica.AAC.5
MLYSQTLVLAASLTARSPCTVSMHGSQPDAALVAATQRWVDGIIVGHNLCPFAAAVRPHTRYVVCRTHTMETFDDELRRLDAVDPAKAATTLVLLPGEEFAEFAGLMGLQPDVQQLADEMGADVQILPFHPLATYGAAGDDEDEDDGDEDEDEEDEAQEAAQLDAFDFSTRSPVPMLHLLRQADVDAGEEQWFSQGGLPIQERNAAYLRGIGYEQAAALRAAALAESPPST